jgi:putative N6-adenine-specific DNA methylase
MQRRDPSPSRTPGPATHDAFAVAAPGLAPLVAAELRALGIRARRPEAGGVAFAASTDALYSANLWSRTASRILVRIGHFPATAFHELERRARRLPWPRFIGPSSLVHVRVTCHKSALYHSDAVAERVIDAITRSTGALASDASAGTDETDETDDSDDAGDAAAAVGPAGQQIGSGASPQLVVVRISRDQCTISIDSSGELLHRRGYRLATAKAPIRETLAAAMLLASDWTGDAPLLDPLCGSGTIPIEAALIARRRAPGIGRGFAFAGWPEFDAARFDALWARARDGERTATLPPIVASDRDAGATAASAANAVRAGVEGDVEVRTCALSAAIPPPGPGWLVTNPPYGVRVRGGADVRDLHARLGQLARARCTGWRVALLVADPRLASALRLPLSPRLRTSNGGIPVTLLGGTVPTARATASGEPPSDPAGDRPVAPVV